MRLKPPANDNRSLLSLRLMLLTKLGIACAVISAGIMLLLG